MNNYKIIGLTLCIAILLVGCFCYFQRLTNSLQVETEAQETDNILNQERTETQDENEDINHYEIQIDENTRISTYEERLNTCEEKAGYYLNYNNGISIWNKEETDGETSKMNGNITYLKRDEYASTDVTCRINQSTNTIEIDLYNHEYLGKEYNLNDEFDTIRRIAALARPCKTGKTFSEIALFDSGINEEGNLTYYGVIETMGFLPEDTYVKNTCYILTPASIEVIKRNNGYALGSIRTAEEFMSNDFLLEHYDGTEDGGAFDNRVKEIFSENAYNIRLNRDYWEYFPYERTGFDERAMKFYNLK